jgi:proteic killer suppression protein
MIVSFRHKGLKELYEEGSTARLPQERIRKIDYILAVLNSAETLEDLNRSGFRLHYLKRPPLIGYCSIDVSGNYRIVFQFRSGQVIDVDFLDTH